VPIIPLNPGKAIHLCDPMWPPRVDPRFF